jgi:hypothetical protein
MTKFSNFIWCLRWTLFRKRSKLSVLRLCSRAMLANRLDAFELAGLFTPVRTEKGFRSMFGLPSAAFEVLLDLILRLELPRSKFSTIDLFITLNFLKDPPSSWYNAGCRWKVDGRTIEKTVFKTLKLIDFILPEVFLFLFFLFFF